MIKQVQVVQPGQREPMRSLEGNAPRSAAARRAARSHQVIAGDDPEQRRRDRRSDEMVRGLRDERRLVATVAQELVRVRVAPVLVKAGAEPQILDPVAAGIEKRCDGMGFGQPGQRPRRDVDALLQIGPQMRRAKAHNMTQRIDPRMLLLCTVMAGAARHQSAHRVAHQHELGDRDRPLRVQSVEQFGERSPVGRDVQSGVITQTNRAESEIFTQPLGIAAVVVAFAWPTRP